VAQLRETTGRPLLLIAESDRNDPRTVTPRSENGMGMDAQWDDDVHHSLHTLLTGEDTGYYTDFAQDPLTALNATLGTGFFHAGTYSSFRGRTHGKPAEPARLPAWRLVAFLQNHDQVGNRAAGDRLSASLSTDELAMAAAILVMLPFTPMLFMGEEWGASTPWQFFTGYTDEELARSVTEGRRREFAEHGWGESAVPDPQSQQTLRDSVLRWDETDRDSHASLLRWHRDLLQWRRERRQAGERPGLGEVSARTSDPGILTVAAPNAVLVAHRGSQPRALSVEEQQHMSLLELTWGDATLSGGVLSLEPGSCAMGRRA
jgi:maltooligosyltrehalose trehalohydrolase